jgi:predicted MFS family arabinose efflux permease
MDRRLLVLALSMFSLGTGGFIVTGVLPQISNTYGVTVGAAGQMTTAFALTYAVLAPLVTAAAASVPRKRLLLSGLAIFVLANIATALAPTYELALITRAVAGLGAAMFAPTATGAAPMLVAPERRGYALSVAVAGLTSSTALGSPMGAIIGSFVDWRWAMVFVAVLATIATLGVQASIGDMPLSPKVSLAKRFAPLADPRASLTLIGTLLNLAGIFVVYTYFPVVFDRAHGGNAITLACLLVLWGLGGTASNLLAGRLIDVVGNRRVLVLLLVVSVVVTGLLPLAGANLPAATIAIAVWGACGWGILVAQQHRLVTVAPHAAPMVLALNTSCTYLGISAGGVFGAFFIPTIGAHNLGFIGGAVTLVAFGIVELATWRINAANTSHNSEVAAA